jgi:TnsA endonuclease N terminal
MGLKRKPPDGNVRRVAAIDNNSRYAITNKNGETVQCESHMERKLALRIDRDPRVKNYRSQPLRISYDDSEGNLHNYVPDFLVWRWDGLVEIHEVTLSERRLLPNAQGREKAAREYCDKEGWRYVVHTEGSLPNETEGANLLALYAYRPSVYSRADVAQAVIEKFGIGQHILLHQLISDISQDLDLPYATVSTAIYHLMWYGKIATDLRSLIFVDSAPTSNTYVWLPEGVNYGSHTAH